MALNTMSIASLLHKCLNQSQIALDLATISNNVEIIVSKFYLVTVLVGASCPVLISGELMLLIRSTFVIKSQGKSWKGDLMWNWE